MSMRALQQLTTLEASHPGRKMILWVSPGWPLLTGPAVQLDQKQQQHLFAAIVEASTELRRTRITLYNIKPLGATENTLRTFYYEQFVKGITKPYQVNVGNLSLQVLAVQSGGLVLSSSNDISAMLEQAFRDADAWYEISFQPASAEPNEYHQIEVRVDKPGLIARTRRAITRGRSAPENRSTRVSWAGIFETTMIRRFIPSVTLAVLAAVLLTASLAAQKPKTATTINPATMPRVGTIDERFQSYNVEMVEVTGGRFWKPYRAQSDTKPAPSQLANQPAGMSPSLFQYRPPINLTNPRLRKLAAALGPAYLRVSGTWQNSTYFQDSDDPPPQTPPQDFTSVLTRKEWKGVIDFSHAADAKIITSFAISPGTRDAAGIWIPDQASHFLAYTKSIGGSIAAAEFMNEPTFAMMGGAPKGYDAAAYARDVAVFVPFIRKTAADMVILGPGGVGEGVPLAPGPMPILKTEDLLRATASPAFNAFSYHFYGAVSSRCSQGTTIGTTPEAALSDEWLSRTGTVEAFYVDLRDRFMPGKPLWLTETGQAACGGDRWASTFIDSFRYLNQLGLLAQRGVQVVAHNTLSASDYGLLDENTYTPRSNYWAALLWRKLMGTTVLNSGDSPSPNLKLYAHCLRDTPDGVALLVINTDRNASLSLDLPAAAERYTLTASNLLDTTVELNGTELKLGSDDTLPPLTGTPTRPGKLTFAPASITFLAIPKANNATCRQT